MSKTQDLVVKMTINSADFESGLKNAKSSINKFNQSTISASSVFKKAIGSMVKAASTLGIAMGGAELFKSMIKSTQTFGDKWNNTMVAAKTSFQVFEQAVVLGNGTILANFKQSIAAAREFAQAMDAFGSAQISNKYARMEYVTPFNEAMTKYRDMKASDNATGMAFAASDMQRYLKAYSDNAVNLMTTSMKVVTEKLDAYTGGFVNSGNVKKYIDQLYLEIVNGVFPPILQDFKNLETERKKGDYFLHAAEDAMKEKYGPGWRKEAEAMNALANINDETLNEMLGVLQTYDQVRNEINSMRRQMNRVMGGGESSATTPVIKTTASPKPRSAVDLIPGLTPISPVTDDTLQRMDALGKKLAYTYDLERMNAEMALEWQMQIDQITLYADTINSAANAFTALGNAMGDTPFGGFISTMGTVAQQVASLVNTYAQLISVQAVAESLKAGTGIPFPFNLVMIGSAVTALATIISAAKSNFAGSFANGGIVPGNSYTGDKLWIRVNSGERVLTRAEQYALANNSGGNVRFIIEGSQLKGVLDNYNKTLAL